MKIIKVTGAPLVERNNEIKAYIYVTNRGTRKRYPLGEWRSIYKASHIDLNTWILSAVGYNYISEDVRRERESVEAEIRYLWDGAECHSGAVFVYYLFGVELPKSFSKKNKQALFEGKYFAKTPDEGNYTYSLDNRLKGIAYDDDKCIARKFVERVYVKEPFTYIAVAKADIDAHEFLHACHKATEGELEKQKELVWAL